MNITIKISKSNLKKDLEEMIRRINAITVNELHNVGLQIITEARLKSGHEVGGFNDQTGALRASIGYIVLHNGSVLVTDFDELNDTTGAGAQNGLDYANEVGLNYPKGFVLVMVAGQEYATYVEDLGYDVISGSTMMAGKLMKEINNNIKNAFE